MIKKEKEKPKTQRTDKEVKEAIVKAMDKRNGGDMVKEALSNAEEMHDKVQELKSIVNDLPSIDSLLVSMNEKLNKVILMLIEQKPKNNQTKLSEMSLSDLNYLKEMLNRNITMNNYQGGDMELKVKSNSLIVKIMDEINNRINLYE